MACKDDLEIRLKTVESDNVIIGQQGARADHNDRTKFCDLYQRLKAMASRHRLRQVTPQTLCTTEVVHEVYMRMGESKFRIEQPEQFFAYAARTIRHVLIDHTRHRQQLKRGGDSARSMFEDPAIDSAQIDPQAALQLNEALIALERTDARAAQVVELHYFIGLSLQDIADVLGVSRRTVDRDWRYARAFLAARMGV